MRGDGKFFNRKLWDSENLHKINEVTSLLWSHPVGTIVYEVAGLFLSRSLSEIVKLILKMSVWYWYLESVHTGQGEILNPHLSLRTAKYNFTLCENASHTKELFDCYDNHITRLKMFHKIYLQSAQNFGPFEWPHWCYWV